jgi:hypothetical protein
MEFRVFRVRILYFARRIPAASGHPASARIARRFFRVRPRDGHQERKMKFTAVVLAIAMMASAAGAETLGDIDSDGAVGVKEAVYALQVASGARSGSSAGPYDFGTYLTPAGSQLLYQEVNGSARELIYVTVDTDQSTFPGMAATVANHRSGGNWAGLIDYYAVSGETVVMLGYRWKGVLQMFSPPRTIGSRQMMPGATFTNMYEQEPDYSIRFREYVFSDIATVTVPAADYPACIKMVQRRENGIFRVGYYADGVGLVKQLSAGGGSGFKWELVWARIAGVTYPQGALLCALEGTWALQNGSDSGQFQLYFTSGQTPIRTIIYISGGALGQYHIMSSDGAVFTEDTAFYDASGLDDWLIPDIELTLDQGAAAGRISEVGGGVINLGGSYACD